MRSNHPAFDDFGSPITAIGFDFASLDEPVEQGHPAADAIQRLIGMLASGNAHADGMRVNVLAYLLDVSEARNQFQLAETLNISPGRISQIIRALPPEFRAARRRR